MLDNSLLDTQAADSRSKMRSLVGKLQWVASQTRSDLSFFRVASLATVTIVTMSDITQANKIVRQLIYEKNLCFRISHVEDLKTARFIVYSDASLANNSDNSTQGGFLIGLSQNDENFIPLAW